MTQIIQRYRKVGRSYWAPHRTRGPQRFRCPRWRLGPPSGVRGTGRQYCRCRACSPKTALTRGTAFKASWMPPMSWLPGMHQNHVAWPTSPRWNRSDTWARITTSPGHSPLEYNTKGVVANREEPRQLRGFEPADHVHHGDKQNDSDLVGGSGGMPPRATGDVTGATMEHTNFAANESIRSFNHAWLAARAWRGQASMSGTSSNRRGSIQSVNHVDLNQIALKTCGARAGWTRYSRTSNMLTATTAAQCCEPTMHLVIQVERPIIFLPPNDRQDRRYGTASKRRSTPQAMLMNTVHFQSGKAS